MRLTEKQHEALRHFNAEQYLGPRAVGTRLALAQQLAKRGLLDFEEHEDGLLARERWLYRWTERGREEAGKEWNAPKPSWDELSPGQQEERVMAVVREAAGEIPLVPVKDDPGLGTCKGICKTLEEQYDRVMLRDLKRTMNTLRNEGLIRWRTLPGWKVATARLEVRT
jgi:hypothetical protein